ncbi:MAG: zinc-binding dehydrogenase [Rhizobiales bacterium]|nr:zinc-binding dehydrogenase [Hyphomicrobiales bacterium]
MKAIVIHRYGPPDVLQYQDVPDPEPRAGEIRIKVHAASVNRVLDVAFRAGKQVQEGISLPVIPGVDCAGIVDRIGKGVTGWRVGDRVAATGVMPLEPCAEDGTGYAGPHGMLGVRRPGGFAELATLPAAVAAAVPAGLGFHEATVIMRHAPTAWKLLFDCAALKSGETILVMGAGGNLGTIGVQIAKHVIGATVIAAAGSDDRVRLGLTLGADHGINYGTSEIAADVMRITGGQGVDVLYDNVANPVVLPQAFRCLGRGGRMVTAGAHAGPVVPIDISHLYRNNIAIRGTHGSNPADRAKCFAAAAAGRIRAQIAVVLPLSRAADAHRLVESGEERGKIVLDPTLDTAATRPVAAAAAAP